MQRTTTEERLLYRKGIELKFVLDYFLLFFLSMSVLFVFQNEAYVKGKSLLMLSREGILMDAVILGVISLFVSWIVENIVINVTLFDTKDNKIWLFILSLISTSTSMWIAHQYLGLFDSSISPYIWIIPVVISFVFTRVSLWKIGLVGIVVLGATLYVANGFEYGVSFAHGVKGIIVFSFIVFILNAIVYSFVSRLIQKSIKKQVVQFKLKLKTFIYPFLLVFILPIIYVATTIVGEMMGWIEIHSIVEVIIIYPLYIMFGLQANFTLSSVKTKKQTVTRTTSTLVSYHR